MSGTSDRRGGSAVRTPTTGPDPEGVARLSSGMSRAGSKSTLALDVNSKATFVDSFSVGSFSVDSFSAGSCQPASGSKSSNPGSSASGSSVSIVGASASSVGLGSGVSGGAGRGPNEDTASADTAGTGADSVRRRGSARLTTPMPGIDAPPDCSCRTRASCCAMRTRALTLGSATMRVDCDWPSCGGDVSSSSTSGAGAGAMAEA